MTMAGASAAFGQSASAARTMSLEFGAAAPDGTGFVRVVNALPEESGEREYEIGGVQFGPIGPGAVTAYRPVAVGSYRPDSQTVQGATGGDEAEGERVEVRQDGYVTVAFGRERVYVIADHPQPNARLAQLVLYNLTQWRPLDLTVIPQDITALQAVPRGGSAAIAVNPIDVTLGVRLSLPQEGRTAGARRVGTLDMTPGDSFGIFAIRGEDGLRASLHRAEVRVPSASDASARVPGPAAPPGPPDSQPSPGSKARAGTGERAETRE